MLLAQNPITSLQTFLRHKKVRAFQVGVWKWKGWLNLHLQFWKIKHCLKSA